MKKEKPIIIAVPSEDVIFVPSLRIYNVKVSQDFIEEIAQKERKRLLELLPELKEFLLKEIAGKWWCVKCGTKNYGFVGWDEIVIDKIKKLFQ